MHTHTQPSLSFIINSNIFLASSIFVNLLLLEYSKIHLFIYDLQLLLWYNRSGWVIVKETIWLSQPKNIIWLFTVWQRFD